MCGRFALFASREALEAHFQSDFADVDLRARYNIAPSQEILVLTPGEDGFRATSSHWGFVPAWSRDGKRRHLNARAETVAETPTFRAALRGSRCLIPASGYFEWESDTVPHGEPFSLRAPSARRPHWHAPAAGGLVAFAAIAARWPEEDADAPLHCAILTTVARGDASAIHDRMPLVVPDAAHVDWLREGLATDLLEGLIARAGELSWRTHAVSDAVNNPRNDGPELLRERI